MPRKLGRRNWEMDNDSDSSASVVSVDSQATGQNLFGAIETPDVLYSVNYVDESRRLYGTIGSNKEIKINMDGPDTDDAMPQTDGQPVIEIRSTAVCTSRHARVKLTPFSNIYYTADSPIENNGNDDDGEEEEKSTRSDDDDDDDSEKIADDDDDSEKFADDDDSEKIVDDEDEKAMQRRLQKLEIAAVRSQFTVQSVDTKRMIIHSPYLTDAIDAVNESTSMATQLKEPYAKLYHMREDLARFRDNQPVYHGEQQRATTAKHIDVLLDYLQSTLGDRCRAEERRYAQNPPMATFNMSWLLYKPHEVAYAQVPGRQLGGGASSMHWRAYIIKSVDVDLMKTRVHCWSLVYSQGSLKREPSVFTVHAFTGEQSIQELPLVPARFFPENLAAQDGLSMQDWQIKLGRQFWDLIQGPAYKEYVIPDEDNTAADETTSVAADGTVSTKSKNELVERVVVDVTGYGKLGRPIFPPPMMPPGMYGGHNVPIVNAMPPRPPPPPAPVEMGLLLQFAPRCGCDTCWDNEDQEDKQPGRFSEFTQAALTSGKAPTSDLFYQVCEVEVPAFFLSKRDWFYVHLAQLQPVQTDHEAFENLVLDAEIKTTVRALVGKFAHDVRGRTDQTVANTADKGQDNGRVAPWPRDIVKNKGEGRIFLLHGSPGVGKTCTAECIAELAQRPLLALTSGDISTEMNPDAVERNLDMYLRLGERYGALVLLDEADVFLEARRASDLRRNGLVSVFLRALEYFRGVLFLTTNRVETFDDAFTSRIHVALHYRPLSAESRRRVWMQHFARIERDSGGRIFVLRSAREYAYEDAEVHALELNGREIRNALQTAVALAEADALDKIEEEENNGSGGQVDVTVTEAHLRAVIKMSAGFKLFMIEAKSKAE
ncbi:hypothetical protein Sste5346_004418 [Sporothrix stenoceras]|uniref:AAA+ ATPase domain-containing protein n=1 Tax=Sporothrix stenoceras TaxID=5173 RepID=A0ABR3Z7Z6_9PEZI